MDWHDSMNERNLQSVTTQAVSTFSEVNFHRGNTLLKLSNTYPSLLLTIIESIQNAIDGMGTRIFVGIDLRTRRVSIADNGSGVDVFTFEKALTSVGQSIKTAGKLGRFGLGLISPLNKCESFTFTSSSIQNNRRSSTRWTFNARSIGIQHRDLTIPRQTINSLPGVYNCFKPYLTGEYAEQYRTVVNMDKVTEDKVISIMDLDELENETLSKLGNAMRRNKEPIKILVVLIDDKGLVQRREITANDFSGEKLPEIVYKDKEAGTVTITLYRAQRRSGQRRGLVSVMEANNPSSISIQDFGRQARMTKWKDDINAVISALTSGYFEGTISSSAISLSPERTKFENNVALRELYYALGLWFEEHGKSQFKNEQDASRENRYQELGLQSQERIRDFLNQPAGERIMAALHATVKFGRLGNGHVSPTSGKPNGLEPISSVRVGQGGAGVPRKPSDTPSKPKPPKAESNEGRKDRPGDTPFGTTGPRGTNRRLVRGDSQGLWYEHSDLATSSRLWEFDLELGVLTFNVRHPLWTRLDETNGKHIAKNKRWILHLQEWLTLQVLNLLVQYPDANDFDERRCIIDDQQKLYVEMFIVNGSSH